jgi:hypothetical protein
MSAPKIKKLSMRNFGPIKQADIEFGDLTVVVGPQATGKSIFLQTLKLMADRDNIHDTFAKHSVDFKGHTDAFLDGYFGNGMSSVWKPVDSRLGLNGKPTDLLTYAKPSRTRGDEKHQEHLFFIPAQRVVSLPHGQSQTFGAYRFGDPYTLRAFSDVVHHLLQNEFGAEPGLFPKKNRLTEALRKPISKHLFGGAELIVDSKEYTKRLVLNVSGGATGLPYLAWSAGQREFTPLLLGMYWLCPPGNTSRREKLEWVVIEELEMGLHPQGINTVLLLVLELLSRGYKVVISTHSPHVLDMVWALQVLKKNGGDEADVRELFDLNISGGGRGLAQSALEKEYRVYYFKRDGEVQDISNLDPGAASIDEAGWGGLSEFSGKVGDVVSKVVNRPKKKVRRSSAIEGSKVKSSTEAVV